ncbi:uncharacterized protein SPPG_07049 [Spizellomyces punctatus DAOM BR117]|uniref:AMP-dependent synthetase/ligase domain-containing protein n=1 Tax=Spizellomyces punctatus (strain DAOM BR117) TaxID=645134 RepID=A0A0L0H8S4_SPIPD|nr:uncharacterized protein SPPG_07049 [Spizellomyces punctatus DAOM BR117]KNC97577.1 hypothetical protein SPPG_07049 [Spizellomyces punctatus DAOM BR117]|eukprot:XP_016605617.1 hypothetical protein SPPG_07049 [Spizellomyces punctatus DAOM BR117]
MWDMSIGKGTVGILVDEGIMLPILMLAVLLCSPKAALVPMDATDPRLHYIIDDTDPDVVIAKDDAGRAKLVEAVGKSERRKSGRCVTLDALTNEMKNCGEDDEAVAGSTCTGADVSHIYFTSGSTGRPKGCITSRSSLTSYSHAKNTAHQINSSSTIFVASSHTFDPSLGDFISAWIAGATVALAPRTTIFTALFHCLSSTQSTHVLTTPALFGTLQGYGPKGLPALQVIALGGEPTPQSVVDTWAEQVVLLNTYGVTECCVYQTACRLRPGISRKNIGAPLAGNSLLIMSSPHGWEKIPCTDPTEMLPVAEHSKEIGELWISGHQVGLGYLNRPTLTAERFINHPVYGRCFRTGDIVARDDGNGWKLLGRMDTQVKISGQRIETEEIEHALMSSATSILLSSVTVIYHQTRQLVAFCIPQDVDVYLDGGEPASSRGGLLSTLLRILSEETLPRHMVPARFVFVRDLPKTGTGKIARSVLAKEELPLLVFQSEADDDASATMGGWTAVVGDVWTEVLGGVGVLGIQTHFMEAGGDSLAALRACQRLSHLWKNRAAVTDAKDQGGDTDTETRDGLFGELLGVLAPIELLKRPILVHFAEYLYRALGDFDSSGSAPIVQIPASQPTSTTHLSLLYTASGRGAKTIVDYLLQKRNLHVDGGSHSGRHTTPLHCAAVNAHFETAQLLLNHNANPFARDPHGATPLHLASQHGPKALVSLLLDCTRTKKGVNPLSNTDDNGQTPLHHAARGGAPSTIIDLLMQSSPNPALYIHTTDTWTRTPLHWAVVNGWRTTVAALLAWGANPKLRDKNHESCIEIAERRARCGANERGAGVGASVFGDIARMLGGSGRTVVVGRFVK